MAVLFQVTGLSPDRRRFSTIASNAAPLDYRRGPTSISESEYFSAKSAFRYDEMNRADLELPSNGD